MGWNTPASAIAGQQLLAAFWNAQVRDNFNALHLDGTWSPIIGGAGGTSGQAYAAQAGFYIKIGKLVIAWFNVILSTKGSITGAVQIQGLPFTIENVTGHFPVGPIQWTTLATNWVAMVAQGQVNTTVANVIGLQAAGTSYVNLGTADLVNTSAFDGTLVYRTLV
jgi:hypothetical protein